VHHFFRKQILFQDCQLRSAFNEPVQHHIAAAFYAPSDKLIDEDNSFLLIDNAVLKMVVVDVQVSYSLGKLLGELRFDLERRTVHEDHSLEERSAKVTVALIEISYKFNIPELAMSLVVRDYLLLCLFGGFLSGKVHHEEPFWLELNLQCDGALGIGCKSV